MSDNRLKGHKDNNFMMKVLRLLMKFGKWQKIKTQTFGKYITFDCDDTEFTLCAVKSKDNIRRYILYILIALAIIVLCFIIKTVKRRNKNVL